MSDTEDRVLERLLSHVTRDPETDCWGWTGGLDTDGYGQVRSPVKRRTIRAQRAVYEAMRGPIPKRLELDHLCRVRCCVNPDHLEPVTHQENTLRGIGPSAQHARKTHCPKGHPYSGYNLMINIRSSGRRQRVCRQCHNAHHRARRARRAAEKGAYHDRPRGSRGVERK